MKDSLLLRYSRTKKKIIVTSQINFDDEWISVDGRSFLISILLILVKRGISISEVWSLEYEEKINQELLFHDQIEFYKREVSLIVNKWMKIFIVELNFRM